MAKKSNDDSKIWAFLGVFLTLLGFILVLLTRKKDKYAMYYAKHGLVLFIAWVVITVVSMIPFLGWIIYMIGAVLLLIAWIVIMVAAFSGEMKSFPVITELAAKINI
tara:strand:+ start:1361 stop:1681 length:321 start_codon:yes stop_codon:yes gene_type:complete